MEDWALTLIGATVGGIISLCTTILTDNRRIKREKEKERKAVLFSAISDYQLFLNEIYKNKLFCEGDSDINTYYQNVFIVSRNNNRANELLSLDKNTQEKVNRIDAYIFECLYEGKHREIDNTLRKYINELV